MWLFEGVEIPVFMLVGGMSLLVHEMGHVLGFGTIWDRLGLRQGVGFREDWPFRRR